MKLTCTYTDQNGTQSIGDFITKITWSGDESQAARKIEFSIAYNPKDGGFTNLNLNVGGRVDLTVDTFPIFSGRIFYRKRSTDTFTFDFTAYDDAIYLVKSKIYKLFDKVSVTDAIKQICNEISIKTADDILNIKTVVTFVADGMTCTEAFEKLLSLAKADLKKKYAVVFINGAINIVERGTLIENYIASNDTNVEKTDHSESIEDMVNRVKLVDEKGNVQAVIGNDNDVKQYGVLQDIYKLQPARDGQPDNMTQAKALLKSVATESSLTSNYGNVQCITGYSMQVQEEQLKGNFYIKADSHTFENNNHTMQLTLEYIEGPVTNVEGNK